MMNQHGFSPSRSARAMRGQSDKVVAIIVTRLDSLSENLAVQDHAACVLRTGLRPYYDGKSVLADAGNGT
ncbi:trehalose repressor, partial [Salmonella enterica subsp. enterica serovar Heidelberg str. SARA32]